MEFSFARNRYPLGHPADREMIEVKRKQEESTIGEGR